MCHLSTHIPHLLTFDGDFYSFCCDVCAVHKCNSTAHFCRFYLLKKSSFYQHIFSYPFDARLTSCSPYFAISVPSWVKQDNISQGGFGLRGTLPSLDKMCCVWIRGCPLWTGCTIFFTAGTCQLNPGWVWGAPWENFSAGDCMFPLCDAKALLHCHRNPENQAGWESW